MKCANQIGDSFVSWVLWRELACRMGVKYIPRDLEQAMEWRKVRTKPLMNLYVEWANKK